MRGELWLQAQLPLPRRGTEWREIQIIAVTVRVRPSKRSRAGWVRHLREGVATARPNLAHELPTAFCPYLPLNFTRHCWSAQGSRTRRHSTAGPGKNQGIPRQGSALPAGSGSLERL
jgi:hypothetical protein